MKIALLTWFHYSNYGTALQVYAMAETLSQMGHEVDVINYRPRPMKPRTLQDMSAKTVTVKVLGKIRSERTEYTAQSKPYENAEREELFASFLSESIKLTEECITLSDLCELNGRYDAFICGSDQIWSPNNFDPRYFLDFVSSPDKMIAYAPSIGLNSVDDRYVAEQMRTLIKRFKHLSVREKQGADLIRSLTGMEAEVVCDPTLLMDGRGWDRLCGNDRPYDEPYMLVYMLGSNDAHWGKVYADAEKRGLSVKVIPVHERDSERDGCIGNAVGPYEFLTLVKHADAVYTDSFHGTVMSLLLHTSVVPFERFSSGDPICQNSRIYNLLSVTGLTDLLVSFDGTGGSARDIDFENVDAAVSAYRNSSAEYLSRSLDEAREDRIKEKKHVLYSCPLCCGCGACENVCPVNAVKVGMDVSGFIRAEVDENKCIQCGKCVSVCPMLGRSTAKAVAEAPLYSFKSDDPQVLFASSSGGFAHTVSSILLERGYSVAGCIFDEKTQRAKHVLIRSAEELSLLQGSKYMQSDFSSVLGEILRCGTPVVLFGTPCQISGARKLLKNKKDVIYIDLICHGVPSYNLYRKYRRALSRKYGLKENGIVTKFRYKDKGWRTIRLFSTDGSSSVCFDQREDMYFRAFETGDCYNSSCYECRLRDRSDADIRMGDYWGSRFENDMTGVSMISVFSEAGEELMRLLGEKNVGCICPQPTEDHTDVQQMLNRPAPLFYSEYIGRLADDRESLSGLLRRYCSPFEGYEGNRAKRYSRFALTALDENFHYLRRRKKK
jgi:coenzyme F420-reducing hydrogenase beta subunit